MVRESARTLAGRTRHYGYVSSRSVYVWPIRPGLDESAPVVDGDPSDVDALDYAAAKRGSELAVLETFSSTLIARAGLILGPYEDVGRLPWWLRRIEAGGRVLAPGPRERPLQYIDARDLAAWMLAAAQRRLSGTFNAVGPPGATTMGRLLDAARAVTGSDAQLVWVAPEAVEAAGIAPWTEMPIWVPPTGEFAGLHNGNVKAAMREGLTCRPVEETVADTWAWLQAEGDPPQREDRPQHGISPAREAAALAAAEAAPADPGQPRRRPSQPRTASSQRVRRLEAGQVADAVDRHRRRPERGARHRSSVVGGHEGVLGPADHQHRHLAGRQHVEGVRTGRHGTLSPRHRGGGGRCHHFVDAADQVGAPDRGRGPEQLGLELLVQHPDGALGLDERRDALAVLASRREIGARLGVREDQAAHPLRMPAQDRERDVAAHGRPSDHRSVDGCGVEQRDDIVREDVQRRRCVTQRGRSEAAQVWGEDGRDIGQAGHLVHIDRRGQRERVQQHERGPGGHLVTSRPTGRRR